MANLIIRILVSSFLVYFTQPGSGIHTDTVSSIHHAGEVVLQTPSNSDIHHFISVNSIFLVEYEEDSDSRTKSSPVALGDGLQGAQSDIQVYDNLLCLPDQIRLSVDLVVRLERFLI